MDSITYELDIPAAQARYHFGDLRCRIEGSGGSCRIVLFDIENELKFFRYANKVGVRYRLASTGSV